MRRIRGRAGLACAAALALLGAGCGGSESAAPAAPAAQVAEDEEYEEKTVPVIEWVRLEPDAPAPGGSVTARVRVADPDGDEIELGYAWTLNGRAVRASGDTIPLAGAMKGDMLSVTVTASDGWDESAPATVRTQLGNAPPVLQGIAFDPLGTIHRGQPVTARPIAQDGDGDALEFEYTWWVNDSELSEHSDLLDTSRLRRGDRVRVRVVASDGHSRSNEVMSDPILVDNSPPKITSTPGNSGTADVYRYPVKAEDPDGDRRLRFRLEQAPPGMTIDPIGGELVWTPPASAKGGHPVTVVVDDLQGGQTEQRFTVEVGEPEAAPQATASATGAPATGRTTGGTPAATPRSAARPAPSGDEDATAGTGGKDASEDGEAAEDDEAEEADASDDDEPAPASAEDEDR
jgi:hypothetical protein